MSQYRLLLEYDGTDYHGWQLQPIAPTMQGTLETALATALRHPVRVAAAGRTDAGVHALGQVVTFRTEQVFEARELRASLNALTPRDLVVREIELGCRRRSTPRRHAHGVGSTSSASGISPGASAFWHRYAWHVPRSLDVRAMREAAAVLVGDARLLGVSRRRLRGGESRPRGVPQRVHRGREHGVYRVEANAFLKHMVRAIVGTLVEVGAGSGRPADVAAILAARDRGRAGQTAPPHGLVLVAVRYA